MARRTTVLAPTSASLSDDLRITSNTTTLIKSLGKLSRASLIDLVLQWLDEKNLETCRPYLASDENNGTDYGDNDTNPYTPAETVEELKETYKGLGDRKGGKREVIDRILEGDWRHGISLRQLAMANFQYIEDDPGGHRWTALQLIPLTSPPDAESQQQSKPNNELSNHLPRFHAATFLKCIQREVSPLVKAHYHVHRSKTLPLTFVRIFVIDSPYQYPRQSSYVYTDSSRLIYLAFPDSAPYVYSSLFSMPGAHGKSSSTTTTTDTRTLRRIVLDAIPKALSRPQDRYVLKSTSLTTKNLHTLLSLRGPWRTNSANGAFTIFADAVAEGDPLDPRLPQSVPPRKENRRKTAETGTADEHDQDYIESQKENMPHSEVAKLQSLKRKPGAKRAPGLSDTESAASSKSRKLAVSSRFGTSGQNPTPTQEAPSQPTTEPRSSTKSQPESSALDRLQIYLKDPPFPDNLRAQNDTPEGDDEDQTQASTPTTLSLLFSGTDVIAGLRQLAELGMIDASKMPSWMTGEEGVSSAVVRGGKRIATGTEMEVG